MAFITTGMWIVKDEISLFPGRLLYGLNFSMVIYSWAIFLIFQSQKFIEKGKEKQKKASEI